MKQESNNEQHPIIKSILLHLLPGILIGLGYFALLPLFHQKGYPSLMSLMAAIVLILIPFELGYLLYEGKQKNRRFTLAGIVYYRVPIPAWQYIVWIPVLFVVIGVIFTVLKPIDIFLQQNLFFWIPPMESGLEGGFSKGSLLVTYAMLAVFGAVLGPIVEEFYFRGYLLPRMKYAGKWAPLLHSFLFTLYHVFTPWMIITRTVGMLPLVYMVRRRNLYIGVIAHILVNMIDVILGVNFIIGMTGTK